MTRRHRISGTLITWMWPAIFILCLNTPAWAKSGVWEVCSSCEIKSIREAIQKSLPGDTIRILKGLYLETDILIDKKLFIQGVDFPVLDVSTGKSGLIINADSVVVDGMQIVNVPLSHLSDNAAIRIEKKNGCIIRNNRILNTFFGIYLQHAKNAVVERNYLESDAREEASSGNAIHLWYCQNILVRNNTALKHRDGIYLEFVKNSVVSGNNSHENVRYGLHFMFSDHNEYQGNTFQRNGAGVAVMYSKFIKMRDNLFEENWGASSYGLLLKEITDAQIEYNVFRKNCTGIFVEGCSRIDYQMNDFLNNGWAIKISGGCLANKVTRNNFLANSFDLSINSFSNDNIFQENFWSSYDGYDLDRNGIGDLPYRPVKLFNFIVNQTPETIVLLRSFFVDLINFSEKVNPVFTPKGIMDEKPMMHRINTL